MASTEREELLSKVVESIAEGVYCIDRGGRINFWNRGAERITGYSEKEVIGKKCSDNLLRHVDASGRELCLHGCPLEDAMSACREVEADVFLHHKDGHRVPIVVRGMPVLGPDGASVGAIEVFSDRSERSTLLRELEELKAEVLADPLTKLGNRRYAEINLSSALRELENEGYPFGVLMIDIDHFKSVNDVYGHGTGDRVLRMVGWTLANAVRRNDAASRWGGEEFLVVCPRANADVLAAVAERARALIERSWISLEDGRRVSVTISVGGASAHAGDDAESLVARADERMYNCKSEGRNRCSVAD
jgi:diguanylate cyclase (GGDEF)-like protein/PAS domain S-box-containing protein